MSSAASPARAPKPAKRHRRSTTKQGYKVFAKPAANVELFEVIDDWNHHDVSGWLSPLKPPRDPMHLKIWEQQGRVDRLRDLIPFWRDGVVAALHGDEVAKMGDFLQRLEEEGKSQSLQATNGGWGNDYGDNVWGPAAVQGNDWEATPVGAGEGWGSVPDEDWAEDRDWGSDRGREWDADSTPPRGPIPSTNYGWGDMPDETGWGPPVDAPDVMKAHANGTRVRSEDTSSKTSAESPWNGRGGKAPIDTSRDSWSFVEQIARQEEASHERRRSMHEFYAMSTHDKLKKIQEVVDFFRSHSTV